MKKRSKEINIFSMSALDLFASAMGAFILITLVLFPFFPNTGDSPERVAEVREQMTATLNELGRQLDSAQNTISAMEGQLDAAQSSVNNIQSQLLTCQAEIRDSAGALTEVRNDLQSCRHDLAQTFALVVISWGTSDDVDLHVVDPSGNEYYYANRTFPGSSAALEEDNTRGPGNEIWLNPSARSGNYQVYLNMYTKRDSGAAQVRASLLHKNGREVLPLTSLSSTGEKPLIATFNIDEDGNVSLR